MKTFLSTLLIVCANLIANAQLPTEKDGFLCVEAESFVNQINDKVRKWYVITKDQFPAIAEDNLCNDASGNAYIQVLPDTRKTHQDKLIKDENFCNTAGKMAVISYLVKFSTPGKYYVWVRSKSTGSEDNGVHVGLDGKWPESGQRMQWCEGKNEWIWASKQRTLDIHCGVKKMIFLNVKNTGLHTIMFSMREDGFSMDQWGMSLDYIQPDKR